MGEHCCGGNGHGHQDFNMEELMENGCPTLAVVGEQAPYFSGTAYQNMKFNEIDSDMYHGKWVILFFYPADFTFVCPTELGELQDNYKKLQDMGAEVIAVSTDTHFTHMGWAMSSPTIKKIKYPMLGDPTGEVSMAYGVYQEESGLDKRGTFIIDPDGVLQAMEISAEGLGRSTQELIRKLEALQHMRDNPGVVCPNSWKKDGELKPGEDLVGKI